MKQTKCKICRTLYTKWSVSQKVCGSPDCAIEMVNREKAKKARKADRAAKVKARTRAQWLKLAQQAFNSFIRARDADHGCVDCGEFPKTVGKCGGDWDAGHFLTVGAYPELRFNEDNCHKQLKSCNAGAGKYTHKGKTVSEAYRDRLITKIGLERVEKLEGPHPPAKYTIEDLQGIISTYKSKLKELTK